MNQQKLIFLSLCHIKISPSVQILSLTSLLYLFHIFRYFPLLEFDFLVFISPIVVSSPSFNTIKEKNLQPKTWPKYDSLEKVFSSVIQLCPALCDPMDCSKPGFPVHHQLLELVQTHAYQVLMLSSHLILCCPLLLPSSFPASGSFPMSQFFISDGQSIGISASASVGSSVDLK